MASSPSSPIASLPRQSPPSGSPPPMASSPSISQSNVISSPPPSSPPVISTAPPPSPPPLPASLSPASPPPLPPPPPSAMPPLLMSPTPPLDVPLLTPTLPPPPPPLPSSHPPSPSISPPPPVVSPRTEVPPPPPSPPISPPPPVVSPHTVVPPPPPPSPPISPPPPVVSPHGVVPPPPPPSPPISSPLPGGSPQTIIPPPPPPSPPISPPPPTIVHHQPTTMPVPPPIQMIVSPIASPPPPPLPELPHSGSQTPPSNPLAPQLRVPKQTVNADSPPSPAGNSSRDAIPLIKTVPSLPTTSSIIKPDGDHSNPTSSVANRSSSSGPDVIIVPGSNNSPNGTEMKSGIAAAVVLVSLLVLCLVGVALWFVRKNRKSRTGHNVPYVLPSSKPPAEIAETYYPRSPTAPLVYNAVGSHGFAYEELGNSKSLFTYEELYKFTGGFSSQNLLGEGGFGCVYKGYLPDGREVAVKQLKVGGDQGEREFKAEVEIISRIHHRHLVSLVGYCIAEDKRLLVYAYVPNNTLYYHLHGEGGTVMDWAARVKVAAGSAHGLAYLHEDCHPRIIHRDIKSSNILLDNNFEAQVSDFGLARLALDANTHVTTRVVGTFGYLAPEYASSGKLTDKSDVYSFGVVLLELITGRKPVDTSQPIGDEGLVEWARPMLTRALDTGDFQELPDPRLEQKYNETEMLRMIEAAAACTRHSAAMRPRMGQVVRALDNLAEFDLQNGIIPGQSELFSLNLDLPDVELFQSVMPSGNQRYLLKYPQ